MSLPIWPVVAENLAEQLSAAQGGIVHPAQLLPYLPLSLSLVEQTLDALTDSDRVEKQADTQLTTYLFKESLNKAPHKFAPRYCIYSNEPLDGHEYTVITPEVRQKVEAELALSATNEIWPSEAIWEHELLYLLQNLPAPVSTSAIAGHSRLSFKRTEARINQLQAQGAIQENSGSTAWELPPMRYPKPAYTRNDTYIRQFPGAIKEEVEVRLVKGLSYALAILLLSLLIAVGARIPFPIVFVGALIAATFTFIKILKAPAKPIDL